jgi:hypothetical protein
MCNFNQFFKKMLFSFCALLCILITSSGYSQEHELDENTLLLLHFNDNLIGADSENPASSENIVYAEGIFNNGLEISDNTNIEYASLDNINEMNGTVEFWVNPNWNGNDGLDHYFLRFGYSGGILIGKDAGNYLKILVNRWSPGAYQEYSTGYNVSDWTADTWYHVAFTWNDENLELYINGELVTSSTVDGDLFELTDENFQLGGNGTAGYANAVIDELRISNIVRTSEEISDSYMAGLQVDDINLVPSEIELLETWWFTPEVEIVAGVETYQIPSESLTWQSNNPGIAQVNSDGKIIAVSQGTTTVTGTYQAIDATINVTVTAPSLPLEIHDDIPDFLATPAANYLYEMPVVIIQFAPTNDGVNIDESVCGYSNTITEHLNRLDTYNKRVKFMLEEGSRYHGYKNAGFPPSLGYRVVDIITIYEEKPISEFEVPWNDGWYRPDYEQILTRIDAENYVNNQGVKEFWIWGYHHGNIEPTESNMSSPTTGDISNSERNPDDLPIYNSTYVVYNYSFTRSQAEAVHNHGHQLESIYKYIAVQQDGNYNLFVSDFCGWGENYSTPPIGRAGDCHHPSNTELDYDYENMTLVESDIEDWTPDHSGETTMVNADTWGGIDYNWPSDVATDIPQQTESQWYMYWMQNMPGYGNVIPHGDDYMTNWWYFTADWDDAVEQEIGLYGPAATVGVSPEFADSNLASDAVVLYPNPAADMITVYDKNHESLEIRVFDVSGTLILEKCIEHSNPQVDLSNFKNGVYYIEIVSADYNVFKRIVKIN